MFVVFRDPLDGGDPISYGPYVSIEEHRDRVLSGDRHLFATREDTSELVHLASLSQTETGWEILEETQEGRYDFSVSATPYSKEGGTGE